ncbi:MAG: SDR family NAD(P)-dependent oxidoreductase [Halioglobus sp.]|nr:SDR family NAD(P)-dependent oxidoreductase [Halioglobus sp.]
MHITPAFKVFNCVRPKRGISILRYSRVQSLVVLFCFSPGIGGTGRDKSCRDSHPVLLFHDRVLCADGVWPTGPRDCACAPNPVHFQRGACSKERASHCLSATRSPPDWSPRYPGSGRLQDKVALVTGADSGIGRAMAALFAREGGDVAIAYLREAKAVCNCWITPPPKVPLRRTRVLYRKTS